MKNFGWLVLFGGIIGLGLSAPHSLAEMTSAKDDVAFLRAQYARFHTFPPARQQQLRKLDADLYALDRETQTRLVKVLDSYNTWLAKLPEDDRKRVIAASTGHERLMIIEEIKEREWIETLPKSYRDRFDKAKPSERIQLVQLWREEQHERREEWQIVRRNWEDIQNDRLPPLFQLPDFRTQLDAFVLNLESQLPPFEREKFRKAREMIVEERAWFRYVSMVAELGDRFPLLPGPPDGPRTFEMLPKAVRDILERDKVFSKKRPALPKEMQAVQGTWPGFAIAVADFAAQHKIILPDTFGPTTKTALPIEVQTFLEKSLEPTLKKIEAGESREKAFLAKEQLARLAAAEGKWPDYPRTIMELARANRLVVPGWMLPGKADLWERFRIKPKK